MDRRFVGGMLRDWGIALLVALFLFAGWNLLKRAPISEGEAPDVMLQKLAGTEVPLSEYTGQPVVLNFWATWCGPCISEIPELSEYQQQHADVKVLGVSVDKDKSLAALSAFARRHKMLYTVLHDTSGEAASEFGVSTLPTTFVLNASGEIVDYRVGVVTTKTLQKMVQKARDTQS